MAPGDMQFSELRGARPGLGVLMDPYVQGPMDDRSAVDQQLSLSSPISW